MDEILILVDKQNNIVGADTKTTVHRNGLLHRAFSIFIFNRKGELLLQRRALGKYHSAGLWTNSCCGHPQYGEQLDDAAHRRLREEMSFDCRLINVGEILYYAAVTNSLIEHEYDHIFVGEFNDVFIPNKDEVADFIWVKPLELTLMIQKNTNSYTTWFKKIINEISIGKIISWQKIL